MIQGISNNDRIFICDWLKRTRFQYHEETPKKIKAADYDRARQSLGLGSNITNNYFFSRSQPASRSWFSGDTTTTTNSNNRTYIDNRTYTTPEEEVIKKPKEEKTNWKSIATIGVVSTAVAGISIFVYARLSKAAEGARNYLENTRKIENWSIQRAQASDLTGKLSLIAKAQLEIDQRAVDKITNYKYSILTSLVGTLVIAGGGITILTAASALATAGTTAVVAGGVLNSLAVLFAAYNCGMHWSDEKDGKEKFSKVQSLIPDVIQDLNSIAMSPPPYSEFDQPSAPPSYDESEAVIRNQRENFSKIYPNLSAEFFPSAPPDWFIFN
ncbi:MAG: hypothetical protein ACH349_04405 [Candidatus Rhabdochlamydia sp.]|jgi:hypothetical protein|nr:hypothetical protein [Chlamydiota bacterium]